MDNRKYNYIIYGYPDYYEVGYHDLEKCPNVLYLRHYLQTITNPLLRSMVHLILTKRVGQFVPSYFLKFIYKHMLSISFKNDLPLCFVYFGAIYWSTSFLVKPPYFSYIKQTHINSKHVLYIQDIVAQNPHLNIYQAKEQYDIVLSYDKGDCKKYDLVYHPTPYSSFKIPENYFIPKSDVFFCGKGKDRYPLIHSIYKKCTEKGLVCDFYISDMPDTAERIKGIKYNQKISYIENLQHLDKSKCILEVMQSDADGFTPRVWESLFYNKHLLTNNKFIIDSIYYRKKYTHIIENDFDSITDWIFVPVENITMELRNTLSPMRLIEHIESIL